MLKWEAFEKWLLQKNKDENLSLSYLLEELRKAIGRKDSDMVTELTDETVNVLESLEPLWRDFEGTLGATAKL